MTRKDCSSHGDKPDKQRALVLQGGGALGAYEAGVLQVLISNALQHADIRSQSTWSNQKRIHDAN